MTEKEDMNVEEKVQKMEEDLKKWDEKRREVIGELRAIAKEVGDWEFGTSVSNVVGSSAGVLGGAALIAGILFPPLAVGGLVLGAASGASNIATSVAKSLFLKGKAERIQFLMKNELDDFEKLISNRKNLMNSINKQLEFRIMKALKPEKTIPKVFETMNRMFKKPTTKGIFNAVTFVALSSDVMSILENVDIIANKVPNEFETTVNGLADDLENHRQEVMSQYEKVIVPPPFVGWWTHPTGRVSCCVLFLYALLSLTPLFSTTFLVCLFICVITILYCFS